jgi:hypothetical protein
VSPFRLIASQNKTAFPSRVPFTMDTFRNEIISRIRSCLISTKGQITLRQLEGESFFGFLVDRNWSGEEESAVLRRDKVLFAFKAIVRIN